MARGVWPAGVIALLGLVALVSTPAPGQSALELVDGRVLTGVDVRRDGVIYVLTLETGHELALPVELVRNVRLVAEGGDGEGTIDEGTTFGQAPPPGPTGIRVAQPETLAGDPVVAPTPEQSLAALGKPAAFQKDIVDNRWSPTTDWNMDSATQNNFNPARWAEAPIDSTWKPQSAWAADSDALKDSRSTWNNDIIESTWKPTDGFATSPANRK